MIVRIVGLVLCLTAVATTCFAAKSSQDSLFIVHFQPGPKWDPLKSPSEQDSFREHSANMGRLRGDSTIVFGARYEDLGMILLRADSLGAARDIVEADPGVRAKLFLYRLARLSIFYPWRK